MPADLGIARADHIAIRVPDYQSTITFYTGLDQLPSFEDYSMANRTYRYFHGKPLYGFGYGLSYTTFSYSNLKLSTAQVKAGQPLQVEVDVKNTGSRAGDEVAQFYLAPPQTPGAPLHALAGFERLHLLPGQTRRITLTLDPRQLSFVDEKGVRADRPGDYTLFVGGSQPAPGQGATANFRIDGTYELPH